MFKHDDPRHTWIDARPSARQWFRVELSNAERARELKRSALLVWMFVGIQVSGRRDPWKIGGQEIQEWTGVSRAGVYKALKELRRAGLLRTVCAKCADPDGFYGPDWAYCAQHEKRTRLHELI